MCCLKTRKATQSLLKMSQESSIESDTFHNCMTGKFESKSRKMKLAECLELEVGLGTLVVVVVTM